MDRLPVIGVVGPCGAGKTTLIAGLRGYALTLRHIAQEHSYVPTMWQRITHPDLLIFLDASYSATISRRNLNWTQAEYDEQQRRLADARANANFYLMTDDYTPTEVIRQVVAFLTQQGLI
jgi:deoxyadenosine/deoxycytidine kinase